MASLLVIATMLLSSLVVGSLIVWFVTTRECQCCGLTHAEAADARAAMQVGQQMTQQLGPHGCDCVPGSFDACVDADGKPTAMTEHPPATYGYEFCHGCGLTEAGILLEGHTPGCEEESSV